MDPVTSKLGKQPLMLKVRCKKVFICHGFTQSMSQGGLSGTESGDHLTKTTLRENSSLHKINCKIKLVFRTQTSIIGDTVSMTHH